MSNIFSVHFERQNNPKFLERLYQDNDYQESGEYGKNFCQENRFDFVGKILAKTAFFIFHKFNTKRIKKQNKIYQKILRDFEIP